MDEPIFTFVVEGSADLQEKHFRKSQVTANRLAVAFKVRMLQIFKCFTSKSYCLNLSQSTTALIKKLYLF